MDSEKPYTSSQICLNFGDKVQSDPPFSVHMDLNLMSSKQQNIKFNISQFIGFEIPQNAFVIEIEARYDGQELGSKLKSICDTLQSIKELKDKDVEIRIFGKGGKAYAVVCGNTVNKILGELNNFKEHFQLESGVDQLIRLDLQSNNTLERLKELLVTKERMRSLLDSLECKIELKRSEGANLVLEMLLSQALMHAPFNASTVLGSFQNFKLEINCDSSRLLEDTAAYIDIVENMPKIQLNEGFQSVRNLIGSHVKIIMFNSVVSGEMSISAEDLYLLLDLLLA